MDTTMKTMRSVLLAHLAAITVVAVSGCSAGDAVPAGDERPSIGTAVSAWRSYRGDEYATTRNWAAFDMSFWAICVNPDGRWINTPTSGTLRGGGASATIHLAGKGIVDGANCWVSCDVEGGSQNHQSEDNFTYKENGRIANYEIRGGSSTRAGASSPIDSHLQEPPKRPASGLCKQREVRIRELARHDQAAVLGPGVLRIRG